MPDRAEEGRPCPVIHAVWPIRFRKDSPRFRDRNASRLILISVRPLYTTWTVFTGPAQAAENRLDGLHSAWFVAWSGTTEIGMRGSADKTGALLSQGDRRPFRVTPHRWIDATGRKAPRAAGASALP